VLLLCEYYFFLPSFLPSFPPSLISSFLHSLLSFSLPSFLPFISFHDKTSRKLTASHSYIFPLFYSGGVDVTSIVFFSEVFPNHIRAKGVALAISTIALTDLVYLQATATAFANIGWKFFLVCYVTPHMSLLCHPTHVPVMSPHTCPRYVTPHMSPLCHPIHVPS